MAHLQGMDPRTKRSRVINLAQKEGLKTGTFAGALSTAAIIASNKYSPWFRKSTTVSAKTALAVSPFFLTFFLTTELVMHGANIDPKAYGLTDEDINTGKVVPHKELTLPHKAANYLYRNPFKMVVGMGVPAVAGILYSMRNEANLKLSQKLMHTRVYGQATVLSLVIVTMGFQEFMKRNGGMYVVTEAEEEKRESELEEGEPVVEPAPST